MMDTRKQTLNGWRNGMEENNTWTEIVISQRYGGFGLSEQAKELYKELSNKEFDNGVERYDKHLVQVVKTLGQDANDRFSDLKVLKFKGCKYRITDYDGFETLETPDSIPWSVVNSKECNEEYPEYFV